MMKTSQTHIVTLLSAKIGKFLALLFFLLFAMFPIYWMLNTALKPDKDAVSFPIKYIPEQFTGENFIKVWQQTDFPIFFRNSLIVALTAACFTVILAIFAGYALSRFKFRGKKLTLLTFLGTQMIPIVVMIVPLFLMFKSVHLINTLTSLIISYAVITLPFCSMTIMGFFQRIPSAIEESAMVDGCSRVQALFRVIVPVMLPGIVVTYVFAFISAWNEFFFSVMFINSQVKKTIPVGINMFIQKVEVSWGMMSAAGIISLIPSIIMFMMIQKRLVSGLTAGSVKG